MNVHTSQPLVYAPNIGFSEKKPTKREYFRPIINDLAFAATMDAYRLYVDHYNTQVVEPENKNINAHNASVRENQKNLTEVQRVFRTEFLKKHEDISNDFAEYNPLVKEFCEQHGVIVELVRIPTVKYATELIFRQILHAYQMQLYKKSHIYEQFDINAPLENLPPVKLDAHHIASFKRNGVLAVDVCKKTVRNHIKRMREAAILTNYVFCGTRAGIECRINPTILSIFDQKNQLLTVPENQAFTPAKWKNLPDNEDIKTRTLKNKCKIRENADAIFGKGSGQAPVALNFVYGNTQNSYESSAAAASETEKNVEKIEKKPAPVQHLVSSKLETLILHPHQLAQELSQGFHCEYVPLDIRMLEREAYHGIMDRESFKELAIQDLLKYASRIWKGKNVYVGNWRKVISEMQENWFKAFTGNAFNKHIIVEMLYEYRWRIRYAHRWFTQKQFNALFPAQYFDHTRKDRKEVGFAYTAKAFKKHEKYLETRKNAKQRQEQNALKRLMKVNAMKDIETKVRLFNNQKLTLEQLWNYVQLKHPSYLEHLPEIVQKISLNTKTKTNGTIRKTDLPN